MPLINIIFILFSCPLGILIGISSGTSKKSNRHAGFILAYLALMAFIFPTLLSFSGVVFIYLGGLTLGFLSTLKINSSNK